MVASSNNKAVENVSAELPGIEAVADGLTSPGYFKSVSDNVLGRETWGMVAAVLGNARNRSEFRQKFWWDEELGMHRFFQQASGNPQLIVEKAEDGTPTHSQDHCGGEASVRSRGGGQALEDGTFAFPQGQCGSEGKARQPAKGERPVYFHPQVGGGN
ncbi:hypothetical protein LZK75_17290 [Rhizobium leguminosarum]|nr:hypothetical protein LZK75_17290 [Rhizobium leguminosarum]